MEPVRHSGRFIVTVGLRLIAGFVAGSTVLFALAALLYKLFGPFWGTPARGSAIVAIVLVVAVALAVLATVMPGWLDRRLDRRWRR